MIARHGVGIVLFVVCALLIVGSSTRAYCDPTTLPYDGAWSITNPSGPSLKAEHVCAYDPVGDRMFLFGDIVPGSGGETWVLSFQPSPHWQQLTSAQNPSARSSASMVYDPIGQRILMFGGYDGNYKNDVWQLNLGASPSWTPLSPLGTPPTARHWAAGVFDSVGNRFIIIGGYHGGPTYGDVWALNLSGTPTWEQLSPTGLVFTPTFGHSAVYDSNGDRVLVFGPTGLWSLALRPTPTWSRPSPSGTAPPNAIYASTVFDPGRNRMLVLGGYSGGSLPLTPWELSLSPGPAWRQWVTTGTSPSPRYAFSAVRRGNSVITFGGRSGMGTEVGTLSWDNLVDVQITSLANPALCGSPVPITASIIPSDATGTLEIMENTQVLASAPIQAGVASFNLTGLSRGTHVLTVSYNGSATYHNGVSAPLTQTVNEAPTTITTTTHANPVHYGDNAQIDALVAPASATGVVDFFVGSSSNPFASANLVGGTATIAYAGLPVGTSAITARYRGDGCYASATAASFDQVVIKAVTSISVTTSPNPSIAGFAVTLTAGVTPPSATGLVSFSDDVGSLGSAPVVGGVATLSVTTLTVGTRSITATYAGDANHEPGAGVAGAHQVLPPNPAIVSVRDVKFDQGGRVMLKWTCEIDRPGIHVVTGYRVWRRAFDTVAGSQRSERNLRLLHTRGVDGSVQDGFWEALATLPAEGFIHYAYTAATLQDSMPDQNPYTSYLVSALTSDPYVTYQSNPDSGYSVDNLPPAPPLPLIATYAMGVTRLHWQKNAEADFESYRIYRGSTASFDLDPAHLVSTQPDTGFADDGPGGLVYKVIAVDVHGGVSAVASASLANLLDVGSTGPRSLELSPMRPNPAVISDIDVEFTLPESSPAIVELVDVSGRVGGTFEVGHMGAGRHTMRLSSAPMLRAGIWFVRLRQGATSRVQKLVVIR